MTPSARQLGLLLLLLLTPSPAMTASNQLPSNISDLYMPVERALVSLVSGPLRGHDLLLVRDDHSQRLLDVGLVMAAAGVSLTPVSVVTQDSLLYDDRPVHHTKGSLLTAIIIFYKDPTEFFVLLNGNLKWNPKYLILIALDPHLNTESLISEPVVQRSEFILLLQHQSKGLAGFTSTPVRMKAPLGIWSHNKFTSLQSVFPPRFQDFGGQVLEVPSMCYDEPFMYLGEDGECAGANSDALSVLGEKHNFRQNNQNMDEIIYSIKENGTWKGMLGKLMYEGNHIVTNSMTLNPEECKDFDYTYPYWRQNFAIILRVPPPIPRWRNILYPFSRVTWALVLGTTVIVASLLAILVHCVHNLSDPMDIALKVVSGLFGQAMNYRRVRTIHWARVWLIFWWVSVDILSMAYVSNLMSVLTIPVYPARLQTLQDLAQSDFIPSMVEYGIFVPQALKISKNPIYATLGERMWLDYVINVNDPYGYLLQRVMNGTHALIESIDYLVWTQHKKGLTFSAYIMDEKLYNYYMSWFLPLNTPYTSLFSSRLQRIMETGILAKKYEKHLSSITVRTTKGRGSGVLILDHLQGAFIALGLGLVLSAVVLLLERLVHASFSTQASTTSSSCPSPA